MLAERSRIVVTSDVQGWVRALLDALPRREAGLTFEVALMSRRLALAHQDLDVNQREGNLSCLDGP